MYADLESISVDRLILHFDLDLNSNSKILDVHKVKE